MNAKQLPLEWNESQENLFPSDYKHLSEHTKTNMEIFIKLLRDVKLENRMETLIKAEWLFDERTEGEPEQFEELIKGRISSIRDDLEQEMYTLRKLMFMLEQTETFFPVTK